MEPAVEILLVEDNPNDIKLALHTFQKYQLANHVQVVQDGAEALEFLFCKERYVSRKWNLPKLILLDLKLRLVDGLEVLRQVKTDARTNRIPVVIMTASQEERDLLASYKYGANSYVIKPVEFDRYTEVVRQVAMYWLQLNQVARPTSL